MKTTTSVALSDEVSLSSGIKGLFSGTFKCLSNLVEGTTGLTGAYKVLGEAVEDGASSVDEVLRIVGQAEILKAKNRLKNLKKKK